MLQTIERYFLWLVFYSVIGWIYESTLCTIEEKRFVNRGFLNGPYCPVYGFGAVLDLLVLGRLTNPFALFFCGALLTCSLEYLTSYWMEAVFHTRWWDYSYRKYNLHGRVCLLGAVVFGAFSTLLILFLHPPVLRLTMRIPDIALHITTLILLALLLFDCILTISGFAGFQTRLKEISVYLEQKKKAAETYKNETTQRLLETAETYKSDAAQKLRETPVYSMVSSAHEKYLQLLNKQQLRMLRAFPKLKTKKYDQLLSEIKTLLYKAKRKK